MKADHDKKIQEALDKKFLGVEVVDDSRLDAYKVIYESLSTPMEDFSLPPDFADHVVLKIERRKNLKSLVLLTSSVGCALLIFITATITLVHYYPSFGTEIKTLLTFKASIIFFLGLLFSIQIMDWWLVKGKMLRYS